MWPFSRWQTQTENMLGKLLGTREKQLFKIACLMACMDSTKLVP